MSDKIKRLKIEMIGIYGEKCWLNKLWTPNKANILTAHHIIPQREKKIDEMWNIALLSNNSHIYFNYLEQYYNAYSKQLNGLFYDLNRTFAPPTEEYYEEVERVLKKVRK